MRVRSVLKLVNTRMILFPVQIREACQKMQNAYIRCHDGADEFQLSFQLRNGLLGVDRQFNFSRQLSEKVNDFLARVTANIERKVNKKKKKKKGTGEEEKQEEGNKIEVSLFRGGERVPGDQMCKDILFDSGLCLQILDTKFSVILNAPWVSLITLPSNIMAGFPVYPLKLEVLFADKSECKFFWYKNTGTSRGKKMPEDWVEVGSGYYYTPSTCDIGCHLKIVCAPQNGSVCGPTLGAVSINPVEAGPGPCPFELRHVFTKERLNGRMFRVVSYNILADLYADSEVSRTQLYPYCPPYALSVDYRKQLILKELLGYNADIICLQEVDSKVFTNDLIPTLSSVGFNGVFHKKGGAVSEGLACIFHESRFRCVSSHGIHLAEELKSNPLFADLWNKVKENEALANRILERTTCSQFVVFDSVDESNERIVVANTHQYFRPDADHIRLLQTGMSLIYLEHLVAEAAAEKQGGRVSCIFCGDFNSTPDWGVYRLISTQHVPVDCIDWTSNKDEEVKGVSLSHSLLLASAYGKPEFTNFTEGFAGCLDYIFYQHDQLDVAQVVPLPSTEELQQHVALPSVVFPSDHVALVADMSWKQV